MPHWGLPTREQPTAPLRRSFPGCCPAAVEAEVEDADGYYLEVVNEIVAAGTWDAVQAKARADGGGEKAVGLTGYGGGCVGCSRL